MDQSNFFDGLTVLELSSVLAGPAVGSFFAELGAKVIKIENKKTGGDITRQWRLPGEDRTKPYSAYYCAANWGKKSLFLDLTDHNDREKVYSILTEADIVISNFPDATGKKLGMDYKTLSEHKPDLIFGHISGYGEHDPTPAFDVVLQAETGYLYMTGEPGRAPVKMPVALIDILAAHQLKEGILLALINRQNTGKGCKVTVTLFDSAIASLANQATNWLEAKHIPQPIGTKHPNIAPYGDLVMTLDNRPLVLACGTDKQFRNLCKVLKIDKIASDKRFITNGLRVENREKLLAILEKAFSGFSFDDIYPKLKKAMVPCGKVRKMNEVFEHPRSKDLVLEEEMEDRKITRRVRTSVFELKYVHFDKI